MPDDHDELRDFSWRRLFPWLILQRALRTSLAPQLMLLATLGCLLNPIGWNVATLLFEYDSPAVVDSEPEGEAEEGTQKASENSAGSEEPEETQEQGSVNNKTNSEQKKQDSESAEQNAGTSLREILQREFASEQEQEEDEETEETPTEAGGDEQSPKAEASTKDPGDGESGDSSTKDSLYSKLSQLPGSQLGEIEFAGRSAITGVFRRMVAPFDRFFREPSWSDCFVLATGTLWTLLVWGLFGGAITRIAVMRLGCDETVPMRTALKYASGRLGTYVFSPLFPLVIILALTIPLALLGLLLMRFEFGIMLVSFIWIFVLLAGFAMTHFLLGALFGWPLMWVVTSAEETGDHYEAFSRSFSYVSQRPFHYLFYGSVVVVLGTLGWYLVQAIADLTIHMSYWSVMWGCGTDTLESLKNVGTDASGLLKTSRNLMDLSEGFVHLVAGAFAYSFFWCGAVGIYLLLRKAVDQTEFDEVFLDDEQPPFELPKLRDGPSVVPEVEKSDASSTSEEETPQGEESCADDSESDEGDASDHDEEVMF